MGRVAEMMRWPEGKIRDLLLQENIDLDTDVALLAEVGATTHGIAVASQDDLDLTAVRFEPWQEFVNGSGQRQSMMVRTQPDGSRSRAGDIDLNVYTLRKFANLASKSNPSILVVLFSPRRWTGRYPQVDWEELITYTASQAAGGAFLGYMRQQIQRWTGQRGQKNVNRPELVEAYGFDTKYAAHVVRLGLQGAEYLRTGRITIPMPEELAIEIRSLRTGGLSEPEALSWAAQVEASLKDAIMSSPLPLEANRGNVDMWLAAHYARKYGHYEGADVLSERRINE